ncbi:MAG TPA: OsmC family protein [Gemmatimonadaceae bacterium]
MLEYTVEAYRSSPHTATARSGRASDASVSLDIDPSGRPDAFNPAELLLTALAACLLKGIERVTPMLTFELRSAAVRVHGIRQDSPPRMLSVEYELAVDTDESDSRLDLLHRNLQKYGTVFNTLSRALDLTGTIHRGELTALRRAVDAPRGTGPSQDL